MPTVHLFILIITEALFYLTLFAFVPLDTWSPGILLVVLAISLYPLVFGMIRRYFSLRCPGCRSWFVPVQYNEGERGGLLLGWSWYPRWVKGHYQSKRCGHNWKKINYLPTGGNGGID